ncbi:hypothetical protein PHET_07167 [Paragonimus heterotremus]|uniref:Uncharacterized protein n=1 Tax=Paragonimus heterotremus TaxID=100268 RepID=A0A8J4TIS6_9TREM|nr:hypothetical protein PHET_07167 [Paragonimus heterotremus]
MSVSPTENKSYSQPQYTNNLEITNNSRELQNLGSNQPHVSNEGHARVTTETNADLLEKVVVTNDTVIAWPIRLSSVNVMEQYEQKIQEPEKPPNPVVDPPEEADVKRPATAESIPKSAMSMSLQVDGLFGPPIVNIQTRVQLKNYLPEYNVLVQNTISPGTKGEISDVSPDVPQIRFTCTSPIDTDKTNGQWQVITNSSVRTTTPEDLAREHAQFDAPHNRNHAGTQSPSEQYGGSNELQVNFINPLDNSQVDTKLECDQQEQPEAKTIINFSLIPPNDPVQPSAITENDPQPPNTQSIPSPNQMASTLPPDQVIDAPVQDNTGSEPDNIAGNQSGEFTDSKQPEPRHDESEDLHSTGTNHQEGQTEVSHDYPPGEASESQTKSTCPTSYKNQMELTGGQAVICDEQPQQLIQSYCESVGPNDVRVDKVSVSKEDENLEVKLGHFNSEHSEESEKLVSGPGELIAPLASVSNVEDNPVQDILTIEINADWETPRPKTHMEKNTDMSLTVQPDILPMTPETRNKVEPSEDENEVENSNIKHTIPPTEQGAQSVQSEQRPSTPLHSAVNVIDTNLETSTVSQSELREHRAEQSIDDLGHDSIHLVDQDQPIANNSPETQTSNRDQKDDVIETLANRIQEQEGEVLVEGTKEIEQKDDSVKAHTSEQELENQPQNLSMEHESSKKSDGKSTSMNNEQEGQHGVKNITDEISNKTQTSDLQSQGHSEHSSRLFSARLEEQSLEEAKKVEKQSVEQGGGSEPEVVPAELEVIQPTTDAAVSPIMHAGEAVVEVNGEFDNPKQLTPEVKVNSVKSSTSADSIQDSQRLRPVLCDAEVNTCLDIDLPAAYDDGGEDSESSHSMHHYRRHHRRHYRGGPIDEKQKRVEVSLSRHGTQKRASSNRPTCQLRQEFRKPSWTKRPPRSGTVPRATEENFCVCGHCGGSMKPGDVEHLEEQLRASVDLHGAEDPSDETSSTTQTGSETSEMQRVTMTLLNTLTTTAELLRNQYKRRKAYFLKAASMQQKCDGRAQKANAKETKPVINTSDSKPMETHEVNDVQNSSCAEPYSAVERMGKSLMHVRNVRLHDMIQSPCCGQNRVRNKCRKSVMDRSVQCMKEEKVASIVSWNQEVHFAGCHIYQRDRTPAVPLNTLQMTNRKITDSEWTAEESDATSCSQKFVEVTHKTQLCHQSHCNQCSPIPVHTNQETVEHDPSQIITTLNCCSNLIKKTIPSIENPSIQCPSDTVESVFLDDQPVSSKDLSNIPKMSSEDLPFSGTDEGSQQMTSSADAPFTDLSLFETSAFDTSAITNSTRSATSLTDKCVLGVHEVSPTRHGQWPTKNPVHIWRTSERESIGSVHDECGEQFLTTQSKRIHVYPISPETTRTNSTSRAKTSMKPTCFPNTGQSLSHSSRTAQTCSRYSSEVCGRPQLQVYLGDVHVRELNGLKPPTHELHGPSMKVGENGTSLLRVTEFCDSDSTSEQPTTMEMQDDKHLCVDQANRQSILTSQISDLVRRTVNLSSRAQTNNHKPDDDDSDPESVSLLPEHRTQTGQSNSGLRPLGETPGVEMDEEVVILNRKGFIDEDRFLSLPATSSATKCQTKVDGMESMCSQSQMGQVCCHWKYTEHGSHRRRTFSFPQTSRPFRLYPLPRSEYVKPVCARCVTSRPHTRGTQFGDVRHTMSPHSNTLFAGLFDWVKGFFSRPASQATHTISLAEEKQRRPQETKSRSYNTSSQRSSSVPVDKTKVSRPPSSMMPDLSSQVDISLDFQTDYNDPSRSAMSTTANTSPTFQTALQASGLTKRVETATTYYTPHERMKSAPGPTDTLYGVLPEGNEPSPLRVATGMTPSMTSIFSVAGTTYHTPLAQPGTFGPTLTSDRHTSEGPVQPDKKSSRLGQETKSTGLNQIEKSTPQGPQSPTGQTHGESEGHLESCSPSGITDEFRLDVEVQFSLKEKEKDGPKREIERSAALTSIVSSEQTGSRPNTPINQLTKEQRNVPTSVDTTVSLEVTISRPNSPLSQIYIANDKSAKPVEKQEPEHNNYIQSPQGIHGQVTTDVTQSASLTGIQSADVMVTPNPTRKAKKQTSIIASEPGIQPPADSRTLTPTPLVIANEQSDRSDSTMEVENLTQPRPYMTLTAYEMVSASESSGTGRASPAGNVDVQIAIRRGDRPLNEPTVDMTQKSLTPCEPVDKEAMDNGQPDSYSSQSIALITSTPNRNTQMRDEISDNEVGIESREGNRIPEGSLSIPDDNKSVKCKKSTSIEIKKEIIISHSPGTSNGDVIIETDLQVTTPDVFQVYGSEIPTRLDGEIPALVGRVRTNEEEDVKLPVETKEQISRFIVDKKKAVYKTQQKRPDDQQPYEEFKLQEIYNIHSDEKLLTTDLQKVRLLNLDPQTQVVPERAVRNDVISGTDETQRVADMQNEQTDEPVLANTVTAADFYEVPRLVNAVQRMCLTEVDQCGPYTCKGQQESKQEALPPPAIQIAYSEANDHLNLPKYMSQCEINVPEMQLDLNRPPEMEKESLKSESVFRQYTAKPARDEENLQLDTAKTKDILGQNALEREARDEMEKHAIMNTTVKQTNVDTKAEAQQTLQETTAAVPKHNPSPDHVEAIKNITYPETEVSEAILKSTKEYELDSELCTETHNEQDSRKGIRQDVSQIRDHLQQTESTTDPYEGERITEIVLTTHPIPIGARISERLETEQIDVNEVPQQPRLLTGPNSETDYMILEQEQSYRTMTLPEQIIGENGQSDMEENARRSTTVAHTNRDKTLTSDLALPKDMAKMTGLLPFEEDKLDSVALNVKSSTLALTHKLTEEQEPYSSQVLSEVKLINPDTSHEKQEVEGGKANEARGCLSETALPEVHKTADQTEMEESIKVVIADETSYPNETPPHKVEWTNVGLSAELTSQSEAKTELHQQVKMFVNTQMKIQLESDDHKQPSEVEQQKQLPGMEDKDERVPITVESAQITKTHQEHMGTPMNEAPTIEQRTGPVFESNIVNRTEEIQVEIRISEPMLEEYTMKWECEPIVEVTVEVQLHISLAENMFTSREFTQKLREPSGTLRLESIQENWIEATAEKPIVNDLLSLPNNLDQVELSTQNKPTGAQPSPIDDTEKAIQSSLLPAEIQCKMEPEGGSEAPTLQLNFKGSIEVITKPPDWNAIDLTVSTKTKVRTDTSRAVARMDHSTDKENDIYATVSSEVIDAVRDNPAERNVRLNNAEEGKMISCKADVSISHEWNAADNTLAVWSAVKSSRTKDMLQSPEMSSREDMTSPETVIATPSKPNTTGTVECEHTDGQQMELKNRSESCLPHTEQSGSRRQEPAWQEMSTPKPAEIQKQKLENQKESWTQFEQSTSLLPEQGSILSLKDRSFTEDGSGKLSPLELLGGGNYVVEWANSDRLITEREGSGRDIDISFRGKREEPVKLVIQPKFEDNLLQIVDTKESKRMESEEFGPVTQTRSHVNDGGLRRQLSNQSEVVDQQSAIDMETSKEPQTMVISGEHVQEQVTKKITEESQMVTKPNDAGPWEIDESEQLELIPANKLSVESSPSIYFTALSSQPELHKTGTTSAESDVQMEMTQNEFEPNDVIQGHVYAFTTDGEPDIRTKVLKDNKVASDREQLADRESATFLTPLPLTDHGIVGTEKSFAEQQNLQEQQEHLGKFEPNSLDSGGTKRTSKKVLHVVTEQASTEHEKNVLSAPGTIKLDVQLNIKQIQTLEILPDSLTSLEAQVCVHAQLTEVERILAKSDVCVQLSEVPQNMGNFTEISNGTEQVSDTAYCSRPESEQEKKCIETMDVITRDLYPFLSHSTEQIAVNIRINRSGMGLRRTDADDETKQLPIVTESVEVTHTDDGRTEEATHADFASKFRQHGETSNYPINDYNTENEVHCEQPTVYAVETGKAFVKNLRDLRMELQSFAEEKVTSVLSMRLFHSTRLVRSASTDVQEKKYNWSSEISLETSSRAGSSLSFPNYTDTGDVKGNPNRQILYARAEQSPTGCAVNYRETERAQSSAGRPSSPLEWSLASTVYVPYSNQTTSSDSALPTSPTGHKLAQRSDTPICIERYKQPATLPSNHNVEKNISHREYSNSNLPSPTDKPESEKPSSSAGPIHITISQKIQQGGQLVKDENLSYVIDSNTEPRSVISTTLLSDTRTAQEEATRPNSPTEDPSVIESEINQLTLARQLTDSALNKAISRLCTTTPTSISQTVPPGPGIDSAEDGEFVTVGRVAKVMTDGNVHMTSSVDIREQTRSPLTIVLGAVPQSSVQMSPTNSPLSTQSPSTVIPQGRMEQNRPNRGTSVSMKTSIRMSSPKRHVTSSLSTHVSIEQDTARSVTQTGNMVSSSWVNNLSTVDRENGTTEDQQNDLKTTMGIRLATKSCLIVGSQVVPQTPTGPQLALTGRVESPLSERINSPESRLVHNTQATYSHTGVDSQTAISETQEMSVNVNTTEHRYSGVKTLEEPQCQLFTSLAVSSPAIPTYSGGRDLVSPDQETGGPTRQCGQSVSITQEFIITKGMSVGNLRADNMLNGSTIPISKPVGKTEAGDLSNAPSPSIKPSIEFSPDRTSVPESPTNAPRISPKPDEPPVELSAFSFLVSLPETSPRESTKQTNVTTELSETVQQPEATGPWLDTMTSKKEALEEQIEGAYLVLSDETNAEQPNATTISSLRVGSEVDIPFSPSPEPTYDLPDILSPLSGETFSYGVMNDKVQSAPGALNEQMLAMEQEPSVEDDTYLGRTELSPTQDVKDVLRPEETESSQNKQLHFVSHAQMSNEEVDTTKEQIKDMDEVYSPKLGVTGEAYMETAEGSRIPVERSVKVIYFGSTEAEPNKTTYHIEVIIGPMAVDGEAIPIGQLSDTKTSVPEDSREIVTISNTTVSPPDRYDVESYVPIRTSEKEMIQEQNPQPLDPIEEMNLSTVSQIADIKPEEKPHEFRPLVGTGEQQKIEGGEPSGESTTNAEPLEHTIVTKVDTNVMSQAQSVDAEVKAGEQSLDIISEPTNRTTSQIDECTVHDLVDTVVSRTDASELVIETGEQHKENTNTYSTEMVITLPEGMTLAELKTPMMTLEIAVKVAEYGRKEIEQPVRSDEQAAISEAMSQVLINPTDLEVDIQGEQLIQTGEQEHQTAEEQIEGTMPIHTTHVSGTTQGPESEIGVNAASMAGVIGEQEMKHTQETIESLPTSIDGEPTNRLASSEQIQDTLAAAETIPFTETPKEGGQAGETAEEQEENTVAMQMDTRLEQPIQERQRDADSNKAGGPATWQVERGQSEEHVQVKPSEKPTVSETAVLEDTMAATDLEPVTESETHQQLVEADQLEIRLSLAQEADQHHQPGQSRLTGELVEEKSVTEITEAEMDKQMEQTAAEQPSQLQLARTGQNDGATVTGYSQSEQPQTQQILIAHCTEEPGNEKIEITQQISDVESTSQHPRIESKSTVTYVTTEFTAHMKPGAQMEISIKSMPSAVPEQSAQEIYQLVPGSSPAQSQVLPSSDRKDEKLEETSGMVENIASSALMGERTSSLNDLRATLKQEDFEDEQLEQAEGKDEQVIGLTVGASREGTSVGEVFPIPQVAEANLGSGGSGMIAGLRNMDIRDPQGSEIDEQYAQLEVQKLVQLSQPAANSLEREVTQTDGMVLHGVASEQSDIQIAHPMKVEAEQLLAELLEIGGESKPVNMLVQMAEKIVQLPDPMRIQLTECAKERRVDETDEGTEMKLEKLDTVIRLAERVDSALEKAKTQFVSQVKTEATVNTKEARDVSEQLGTTQPLSASPTEWILELSEDERKRLETAAKSVEGMASLTNEELSMLAEEAKIKLATGGDDLSTDERKRLEGIIKMVEQMNEISDIEREKLIANLREMPEQTSELTTESRGPSDIDASAGVREQITDGPIEFVEPQQPSPSTKVEISPPPEPLLAELLQLGSTLSLEEVVTSMAKRIASLTDLERKELKEKAKQRQTDLNAQTDEEREKLEAVIELMKKIDMALNDAKAKFISQVIEESSSPQVSVSGSDMNKTCSNKSVASDQGVSHKSTTLRKVLSELSQEEQARLRAASKSPEGLASLTKEERTMLADEARSKLTNEGARLTEDERRELEAIVNTVEEMRTMTEKELAELTVRMKGQLSEATSEQTGDPPGPSVMETSVALINQLEIGQQLSGAEEIRITHTFTITTPTEMSEPDKLEQMEAGELGALGTPLGPSATEVGVIQIERITSGAQSETAHEMSSPGSDMQPINLQPVGTSSAGSESASQGHEKLNLAVKLLSMSEEERRDYIKSIADRLNDSTRVLTDAETEYLWEALNMAKQISDMTPEEREALAVETQKQLARKEQSEQSEIEIGPGSEVLELSVRSTEVSRLSRTASKQTYDIAPGKPIMDKSIDSPMARGLQEELSKNTDSTAFDDDINLKEAPTQVPCQPEVDSIMGSPNQTKRRKRGRRTQEDSDSLDRHYRSVIGTYRRVCCRPESHRFSTNTMKRYHRAQKITSVLDALILDTIRFMKRRIPPSSG